MSKIRVIRQGKIKEYCEWRDEEDYYYTSCDRQFSFPCSTWDANGYKFCPHCGRRIKEVK